MKPMRHEVPCFFRCPAFLDVLGRGHWILPRSTSCRKFTLASREKRPPHVAGILVAVGRQELTRTSSPGRTAGQTIDRQLTG